MQAAMGLTEGRRGGTFNHYKTAADALQGLSWVLYSGPACGAQTYPLNLSYSTILCCCCCK